MESAPLEVAGPAEADLLAVRPYNRKLFIELTRAADTGVAMLVLGTTFLLANADEMPRGLEQFLLLRLSLGNFVVLITLAAVWQFIFLLFGLYDHEANRSFRQERPRVVAACTLGAMVVLLLPLTSHGGGFRLPTAIAAWPWTVAAILATRRGLRTFAEHADAHQPRRRVLVVGTGPIARHLHAEITLGSPVPHELVGFVDSDVRPRDADVPGPLLGSLDDLDRILMQTVVDEVLIALPIKSRYAEIQHVLEQCERAGVEARYSAQVFRTSLARPHYEAFEHSPLVAMKVAPDDPRLVVKRAVDILGGALALLVLSPVLVVIALAVRLTSRGPVFFAQERYGWHKRRFRMMKFRTMVVDAEALQASLEHLNEAGGPVFKIANDPRVTPVGRFLRKTSLDELPQFWNVLRGDMSLVGPRPLPLRDVGLFDAPSLMRRFSVVPGITGLWQVSGRSDLAFDDWMRYDLDYIDRWSLALDLAILARTIPAVLRADGAR